MQVSSITEPEDFTIVHLTDTHIGIDLKGVDATSDLQTVN